MGLARAAHCIEASNGSSGVSTCVMFIERNAAAGKDEGESVAADEAVFVGLFLHARGHLLAGRMACLVDVLEHHHLGAVERAVGILAAGKARLKDQRRVAGLASTKPAPPP